METKLSIIAIVISVFSGCFAFYAFYWTAKRDRKQATLDAYNQLQEQAFDKLNLYTPAEILEIAKIQNQKIIKLLVVILQELNIFV